MSLTNQDKNIEAETLNVEGILADFFLKKFEMKDTNAEDDSDYRKKSKHKKHKSKKTKHKHRTRSRSSSSDRAYISTRADIKRASSSEEKDIKRLKKIKNLEARDNNKSNVYLPSLFPTQNTAESLGSTAAAANVNIEIPYGPSLELLLSGTEIKSESLLLVNNNVEDVPLNEMKNESNDKFATTADSLTIRTEVNEQHINANTQEACELENQMNDNVAKSEDSNDFCTALKISDIGVDIEENCDTINTDKVITQKPETEKSVPKEDKYLRSRSRSHSKSVERKRSRSRSRSTVRSRTECHSHSRSRSKSRSRHKSYKTKRSHSKEHLVSRGRKRSRLRSERSSRSTSKESKRRHSSDLENRSKYDKHRSRSRSRYRKHRSRSISRSKHDKYRYRSISKYDKHRSRSTSRYDRHKSRSLSRSKYDRHKSRSQSRSKSDRHRSRSLSRSKGDRYRSRSPSRSKYDRYRSRSLSRSNSKEHLFSRSRKESSPVNRSRIKDSSPRTKSRTRRDTRSKSKENSSPKEKKIDQAKILQIAQKNVLSMIEKGTLPEGLSLDQFKKEQLVSIKAGGKSVQELTDFCAQLSKKENDPDPIETTETFSAIGNQDNDTGFIHHPFKLKEQPMIKLNIKNAVQIPIKTHAEKFAETAKLSSQFPVSSGNQHKQKELEWIPVEPNKSKTVQKLDEIKTSRPVVAAIPQTEILIPETAKVETNVLAPAPPINNTSYIPLPSTPEPTLIPPPLPPLPPPPSSLFQMMPTGTIPNQPEYTSCNTDMTVATSINYALPTCSKPSFHVLPSSSKIPQTISVASTSTFKPTKHIDIASIVTQHFKAQTKLKEDPNDAQALQTLHEAQTSIQNWVESQQVPGLFTGSTNAKLLSVAELCGPKHWNYRVKRDIFARAAPVTEGKGMSLLKKMGWNPGEGLGKNKEGSLEPLVLDIKTDKKGLVSEGEGGKKGTVTAVKELQGKHPVSALMELCSKRKWKPPLYTVVQDKGPPHKKIFLFKVEVNGVEHMPATPSSNKKVAKADAALVCLQALNVFPK